MTVGRSRCLPAVQAGAITRGFLRARSTSCLGRNGPLRRADQLTPTNPDLSVRLLRRGMKWRSETRLLGSGYLGHWRGLAVGDTAMSCGPLKRPPLRGPPGAFLWEGVSVRALSESPKNKITSIVSRAGEGVCDLSAHTSAPWGSGVSLGPPPLPQSRGAGLDQRSCLGADTLSGSDADWECRTGRCLSASQFLSQT